MNRAVLGGRARKFKVTRLEVLARSTREREKEEEEGRERILSILEINLSRILSNETPPVFLEYSLRDEKNSREEFQKIGSNGLLDHKIQGEQICLEPLAMRINAFIATFTNL